jgi:hypothetical protein
MKKNILFTSLFILFTLCLYAQQNHFIYIQADNKQPFYIKLKDKIYSSSSSGYIILSKLIEDNYNVTIGFPKNEWPEQKIPIQVQKKDLGFMLKNFEEKGWGLVDMNNYEIVYNTTQTTQNNSVVKQEATPLIVKTEVNTQATKKVQEQITKSSITKLFTSKSSTAIESTYIIKSGSALDTVKIFIPIEPVKSVNTIVPTNPASQIQENNNQVQQSIPKQQENSNQQVSANTQIKSSKKMACKNVANEEEYKKLRKKMAVAESDSEMLFKASQTFQKFCFTTDQIKTLSFLFLNEDGKYKFFDAAYSHISDEENFTKLSSLLTDEYYIKRFNAMLKN